MQRYFLNDDQSLEDTVSIDGEDARHIRKVMRMNVGDAIICCVGGKCAECELVEWNEDKVIAKVVRQLDESPELPVVVTIAHGLPKGDKLEMVVQKGTELGAFSFVPFVAARSIVKWDSKKADKKGQRLQKIAKEAAEQSHRSQIPEVHAVKSFHQLIEMSSGYNIKIVAFEEEAKAGETAKLAAALKSANSGDSILALIGPEGGLTDEEVGLLEEHGFIPCGFGPRILRTETAPLYLLSAVSYHFELLR